MSLKWTSSNNECGILRKSEFKEKKEELFVFGYSCKLFRDDEKALQIDQGKHLIPWMGDETLKVDRYDARGALHDLASYEAPPGGFDWRVELTKMELDVEQLCDEERYRALHTDEDEEEMYKEEELKRLHAAGYGQVGFNYDAPAQPNEPAQPAEVDEPFLPTPAFKALLPQDIVLPESDKQNVIIEKTAKFIATQGAQMEILIKAKQGDNPQFKFLNRDSELHPYYTALIGLVKAGKWPEKKQEVVEEKPQENEDYLHPSLASNTVIESAPSIPSIHYKPSADCDYTMLVSKLRGVPSGEELVAEPELAPGEEPPPGTGPLPPRTLPHAQIERAPVMYTRQQDIPSHPAALPYTAHYQQYPAYYQQPPPAPAPAPTPARPEHKPARSTGLSLMKNYNTDSDSDVSDCDDTSSTDSKDKDKPTIATPPDDVQLVIDKMADYVARNGAEFADIVRAKGDPRFAFLEPANVYHAYYCTRLERIRNGEPMQATRTTAPVSFSIKKLKEPDPILPKPALPYESSSEDETDPSKQADKATDNDSNREDNKPNVMPMILGPNDVPPAVIYKIDQEKPMPIVKPIEFKPKPIIHHVIAEPKLYKDEKPPCQEKPIPKKEEILKPDIKKSAPEKTDYKRKWSPKLEKHREKKKHKSSNKTKAKIPEREKKKDDVPIKKKQEKDDLENEIISLEDNSDDMIDLTGDQSDTKADLDAESERQKQAERRRRAAQFLLKVGVDPSALPTSSLASAMVDTMESLQKKKAEAEERRRKREKRRHKEKYGYEEDESKSHRKSKRKKRKSSDEEDSEHDSSKKKKRKKEKKSKKSKKKRRSHSPLQEALRDTEEDTEPPVDLANTLKELRSASPTKELGLLPDREDHQPSRRESTSSSDEEVNRRRKKRTKKEREYSEGEWSSDSEEASGSGRSDAVA